MHACKTQSSTYSYAGFVGVIGVAMMVVVGVIVIKQRKVNSNQSLE